ncbi:serine protease [Streptomyces sp. NPDC047097]|uniref:serine protease n=1 Tax=Streptomyces sp. NPDC047097 TaxID=3155260 RepID=UPI0033CB10A5
MPGEESRAADEALNAAAVRIRGEDGACAGAGVLVTADQLLTCAHVVSDALGTPRGAEVAAGAEVRVDFPLAGVEGSRPAVVERWIPEGAGHRGDVAVLRLGAPVPGTRPAPVADPDGLSDRPVRAVGFPVGEPGVLWHRGRLSGRSEGDWIQLSRADPHTAHITPGFSGSAVWDEEQGAVVGIVVAAQNRREDSQQSFAIGVGAVLRLLPGLSEALATDPFLGLETFQESHAGIFFGRDQDIEGVVAALRGEKPAVVLCGPSGCGKSSLALAGVVPRMRREGTDEVVVVNAGADGALPAGLALGLCAAVRGGRQGDPDQVERWLADHGVVYTLDRLRGGTGGEYLVVLDQAEALLDREEAEVAEVVRLLLPRGGPGTRSRLLITLRSDLLDAVLRHPRLGPLLDGERSRTFPLAPMSERQLRQVINEPLRRAPAVGYEPGLAERILRDAGDRPESLPLLGFVLRKLWDDRFGGRLRTETYEAVRGVSGALEEHCERAWAECVGEGQRAAASRLLRGLVRVLPGSETPLRRRLPREEAGEAGWRLACALAERRLLVLRGGRDEPETAELAHETLIGVWPALREQVRDDREFLAGRAELGYDRERWERGAAPLPGAPQLAALRHWLKDREEELSPAERDFLARARGRQRARRRRVRAGWLAAALVLALIAALGTFLVYQSRVSERRDAEARSRALASLSAEAAEQDPGQAALLAMAAYELSPTQEARNALLRRYDQFKNTSWVLSGVQGGIDAVATSNDGTVILATSRLGRATLFVRRDGGGASRVPLRLSAQAFHPMVSRDGRRIGYLSTDGAFVWHDVDRGAGTADRLLGRARAVRDPVLRAMAEGKRRTSDQIHRADFSPDAGQVAMVVDERLRVWDLEARTSRRVPTPAAVEAVWFGPDQGVLVAHSTPASGSGRRSVLRVDVRTGGTRTVAEGVDTYVAETEGAYNLPALGLSGDGGVLVHCREDGERDRAVYRTVRVADGKTLSTHPSDGYSCGGLAVDETGRRFAAGTRRDWSFADRDRDGGALRSAGGARPAGITARLLGGAEHPEVTSWDPTSLWGHPLSADDGPPVRIAVAHPYLVEGGNTLIAQLDSGADLPGGPDRLALLDAETGETRAQVERPAADRAVLSEAFLGLATDPAETLVADVVARNKVVVRALPTLRRITEITTRTPPVSALGIAEPLTVFFPRSDELVTVSGSWIERWSTRDGRRLSKPVDARALGLVAENPPLTTDGGRPDSGFGVGPRPEPGHVQIMVRGDSAMHAVDLRTGVEDERLRFRLGPDNDRARLDPGGRYAIAKTKGAMWELWSVHPGRPAERLVGPLGPLGDSKASWSEGFVFGFTGRGSELFVANGDSVRFQQAARPDRLESYDFAEDQFFLAASRDGRVLLRTDGAGYTDLFRLDPGLWKRQLCEVLGRELTDEERRGLPAGLPRTLCPE